MSSQLTGHQVETANQRGWSTLENGALLAAAEDAGFDVMVTADLNVRVDLLRSLLTRTTGRETACAGLLVALVIVSPAHAHPVVAADVAPYCLGVMSFRMERLQRLAPNEKAVLGPVLFNRMLYYLNERAEAFSNMPQGNPQMYSEGYRSQKNCPTGDRSEACLAIRRLCDVER